MVLLVAGGLTAVGSASVAATTGVPEFAPYGLPLIGATVVAAFAAIKLADLLLTTRKGLATVIFALAQGNAAAAWAVAAAAIPPLAAGCGRPIPLRGLSPVLAGAVEPVVAAACSSLVMGGPYIALSVAAAALFSTLLAYAWDLRRGLFDNGLVANTLRAERRRTSGGL
jgi:hypothetical protein